VIHYYIDYIAIPEPPMETCGDSTWRQWRFKPKRSKGVAVAPAKICGCAY